ncbi:tRNA-uridine aminocarboxypropyltransferase [Turneriella parva]|uniref:tRNA-uridine aminocarboxypropyltransferase n=1 Tax=Turneriella parva (strain ATCC BAA-1111 / DSM 21527 / NCTC 11395 / H) TaxID=869212 RepID=I4B3W6_TURPD|nr:tRNA-uridine aminocarboxypropyltransferase [Turneriella parva]AFM11973.1 DTW domain containing protein [Turneriella parva DSM 21527]
MTTLPEKQRDLCLTCNRSRATCFCKYTQPFETRTRFLILMHPREFKRQRTGTGRVTHLSLLNSEILVGVDFSQHERLNQILQSADYFPALLFPVAESLDAASPQFRAAALGRTPLVIILDATWSSARKMLRSSANLQTLPRLSFTADNASRFVIKRQPRDFCLSTIEAAYRTLDALDSSGVEDLRGRHSALMQTLDQIVEFQLRCTADPNLVSHRI